jgi:hypothetical protein
MVIDDEVANGTYQDGIFYGLLDQLGWKDDLVENPDTVVRKINVP